MFILSFQKEYILFEQKCVLTGCCWDESIAFPSISFNSLFDEKCVSTVGCCWNGSIAYNSIEKFLQCFLKKSLWIIELENVNTLLQVSKLSQGMENTK